MPIPHMLRLGILWLLPASVRRRRRGWRCRTAAREDLGAPAADPNASHASADDRIGISESCSPPMLTTPPKSPIPPSRISQCAASLPTSQSGRTRCRTSQQQQQRRRRRYGKPRRRPRYLRCTKSQLLLASPSTHPPVHSSLADVGRSTCTLFISRIGLGSSRTRLCVYRSRLVPPAAPSQWAVRRHGALNQKWLRCRATPHPSAYAPYPPAPHATSAPSASLRARTRALRLRARAPALPSHTRTLRAHA